jgi:hypothetical protein
MTRKDYVALAAAFKSCEPTFADTSEYYAWRGALLKVALVLQADNPRFDYMRFTHAASN